MKVESTTPILYPAASLIRTSSGSERVAGLLGRIETPAAKGVAARGGVAGVHGGSHATKPARASRRKDGEPGRASFAAHLAERRGGGGRHDQRVSSGGAGRDGSAHAEGESGIDAGRLEEDASTAEGGRAAQREGGASAATTRRVVESTGPEKSAGQSRSAADEEETRTAQVVGGEEAAAGQRRRDRVQEEASDERVPAAARAEASDAAQGRERPEDASATRHVQAAADDGEGAADAPAGGHAAPLTIHAVNAALVSGQQTVAGGSGTHTSRAADGLVAGAGRSVLASTSAGDHAGGEAAEVEYGGGESASGETDFGVERASVGGARGSGAPVYASGGADDAAGEAGRVGGEPSEPGAVDGEGDDAGASGVRGQPIDLHARSDAGQAVGSGAGAGAHGLSPSAPSGPDGVLGGQPGAPTGLAAPLAPGASLASAPATGRLAGGADLAGASAGHHGRHASGADASLVSDGAGPTVQAQVARGLSAALAQRGGTVTLRLQPETLGSVSIQLHWQAGEVAVRFQAADDKARRLLGDTLPTLRHALEARGLEVKSLGVETPPASTPGAAADPFSGAGGGADANGQRSPGDSGTTSGSADGGRGTHGRSPDEPLDSTAAPTEWPGVVSGPTFFDADASGRVRLRVNAWA